MLDIGSEHALDHGECISITLLPDDDLGTAKYGVMSCFGCDDSVLICHQTKEIQASLHRES